MKVKTIILLIFLVATLSGCSITNSFIEKQIIKSSGIEDDPDYDKYLLHKENGEIDENGYYILNEDNASADKTPEKQEGVHVTIATNSLLSINCFSDRDHQTGIGVAGCYLEPGSTIYASEPVSLSKTTNKYEFDKYLIYEINNNEKKLVAESTGEGGVIFTIPSDYIGKEIAIVPIGKLQNRTISFKAYFINEKGENKIDQGNWTVNNTPITSNPFSFDSTKTFIVAYDYTSFAGEYYLVEGYPEINTDAKGVTTFCSENSNSTIEEFTVKLRKYTKVTVENKKNSLIGGAYGIESIKINGEEKEKNQAKYVQDTMKNGDIIEIKIKEGFKLTTPTSTDLIVSQPLLVDGGKQYKITINSENNFTPIITVSKETATQGEYVQRQISNGSITLVKKADSTPVTEGDIIDDNEKVVVSITANNGYYVTGKDVKDSVYYKEMKYSDYVKNQDDIINSHEILKYVSIRLNTDDKYGECEFTYNKESVSGVVLVKQEDEIKLKYTLTDPEYQITRGEGISSIIDNIFNKNQVTVSIKVTKEMDGKSINREEYITISKK